MIADTGIVVDGTVFQPDFVRKPWRKKSSPELPSILPRAGSICMKPRSTFPKALSDILLETLYFEDAFIGSGGFSGSVRLDLSDTVTEYDEAKARTIFGVRLYISKYPSRGPTKYPHPIFHHGFLGKVPFFEEPVAVDVGLTNDGDLTIGLTDADGLLTLEKEGIISIEITRPRVR